MTTKRRKRAMDKPSERKLPAKNRDGSDTDEDNIVRFGPGNVMEHLPCMGAHAGKEVVGLDKDRLLTNNYLKEELQSKNKRPMDILEIAAEELGMRDDPPLNISKPRVVDRW
jgi:hypothetical protein